MLYCHSRVGGNPDKWENSTFYETIIFDFFKKAVALCEKAMVLILIIRQ